MDGTRRICRIMMGLSTLLLAQSIVSVIAALSASQHNAPPVIVEPKNLDKPETLTIIGRNALDIGDNNEIVCSAKNADSIEWKYKSSLRTGFSEIPKRFTLEETTEDDGVKYRKLTDKYRQGGEEENIKVSGYYFCIVSNKFNYVVMTPPIRFLYPLVRGSDTIGFKKSEGNRGAPFRLKCLPDVESRIKIYPDDHQLWGLLQYSWNKFSASGSSRAIIETDRIRINPITGELFFTFLTLNDSTKADEDLICYASIGLNPKTEILSRHQLVVSDVPESSGFQLQTPVKDQDKVVKCLELRKCTLFCLYGGRVNPPQLVFTPPMEGIAFTPNENTAEFIGYRDVEGQWTCKAEGGREENTGKFEVDVMMYPRMLNEENLKDKFVEVGSDVELECGVKTFSGNDETFGFMIDGVSVSGQSSGVIGNWNYTNYALRQRIQRNNIQKGDSCSVSCTVTNQAGTRYKSLQIIVYDKPAIRITPSNGYIIGANGSVPKVENQKEKHVFTFSCYAELDQNVMEATIYWETNHTDLKGRPLKNTDNDIASEGVQKISQTKLQNGIITSEIDLRMDSHTRNTLPGAVWWCSIDIKLYGSGPLKHSSPDAPFMLETVLRTGATGTAGFNMWFLVGIIVGVLFIILLVILIICCIKQNKGEQYYVDEKERMAGHNPEQELDLQGFQDYKRPPTGGYMPINMSDQDPIKGSRTSLDMSEKPLDSDRGSMSEYGDIDPGRFNEDGSFIGQYGKSNNMDV